MLKTYIAVMCGGAAGTALRMWLSNFLAGRYGETFPVGTLAVNVIGSLVIGVFAELTGPNGLIFTAPLTRQVVMIGVLGGFTTFSSFSLQTLKSVCRWRMAARLAQYHSLRRPVPLCRLARARRRRCHQPTLTP